MAESKNKGAVAKARPNGRFVRTSNDTSPQSAQSSLTIEQEHFIAHVLSPKATYIFGHSRWLIYLQRNFMHPLHDSLDG